MSCLLALLFSLVRSLPEDQWRIIEKDGTVQAVWGVPALDAGARSKAVAAWIWSDRQAPRRVVPERIGRDQLADDSGRLTVRISRRAPGKPAPELRLLAAPQAMWLEVPEANLPAWRVPKDGKIALPIDSARRPWRLRLAGSGEGSWWVDVPSGQRSVTLASLPAGDLDVSVLDPAGKPAQGVHGSVQEAAGRGGRFRAWERVTGEGGRILTSGLPDDAEVSLTLFHSGTAPLVLRGRPSALPHEVRLVAGEELSGRLVDERGQPVLDAVVKTESFANDTLPQVFSIQTRSDAKGAWLVRGLPPGQVAWTVDLPGFVPLAETFDLQAGIPGDVGTRTLVSGKSLAVQVVDDAGVLVPGAKVDLTCGVLQEATADGKGVARFTGVPKSPFKLAGTAKGHLLGRAAFDPPYPDKPELVLPRAFSVRGRLVDSAGAPILAGSVQVVAGTQRDRKILGAEGVDGGFELDLTPGDAGVELVFSSARTLELRMRLPAGQAGENRDLGDLQASSGVSAFGRVVRADDGSPLIGARIWTTRQGPEGPAVAWEARDLLFAATDEDGRFRLAGLLAAPAVLRIEATGLARAQIALSLNGQPGGGEQETDLGTIALSAGTSLHVRVDPAAPGAEGATARADVGNRWLEQDLLSAQVWNGEALLANVPAGKVTVSVLAGRRVLCEQVVQVTAGGDQDVDCRRPALTVAGMVRVGGAPVGAGKLLWQPPAGDIPSYVSNTVLPSGLRQTHISGTGRPAVEVAVGTDGRFETDELTPGDWRVTYVSQASGTVSIPLTIPQVERFTAVLPFPGRSVAGTVRDRDGRPVEGARVRELTGGSLALTDAEGRFSLTGLAEGRKPVVQAEKDEEKSPAVEVASEDGRPPVPLQLVLGRHEAPSVVIQVVDAHGAPSPNAFVFLEETGKGQRLLTTGADGKATATLEAPLPLQVRVAAFAAGAWGFGAWVGRDAAQDGVTVAAAGTGALVVTSTKLDGSPGILTEDGWNLAWLLRLIGAPPALSIRQPLRLSGLPAGRYAIRLESAAVTVAVGEDRPGEGVLR